MERGVGEGGGRASGASQAATTRHSPADAWATARPPVRCGPPPAGAVSLAELGDPSRFAALSGELSPTRGGGRGAAILLVQGAVIAVLAVVIRPFALAGVALDLPPGELGPVVGSDAPAAASWVAAAPPVGAVADGVGAHPLGGRVAALLEPVAEACGHSRCGSIAGTTGFLYEALLAGCRRIERTESCAADAGWVQELLDGTCFASLGWLRSLYGPSDQGRSSVVPLRPVPDASPPQVSPDGAGPWCPSARQKRLVGEWLDALDGMEQRWAAVTVAAEPTRGFRPRRELLHRYR